MGGGTPESMMDNGGTLGFWVLDISLLSSWCLVVFLLLLHLSSQTCLWIISKNFKNLNEPVAFKFFNFLIFLNFFKFFKFLNNFISNRLIEIHNNLGTGTKDLRSVGQRTLVGDGKCDNPGQPSS